MEIKLLSCPLCLKPHFEGVDSLRSTLVSVATSHLSCPVCSEVLLGLDKLTIHLFSHISHVKVSAVEEEVQEDSVRKEIDQSIDSISGTTQIVENERAESGKGKSQEKNLRCDICGFCFTDQNILEMHQNLLHQTTPDKKTGLYSYHCHLCSKKFKMRGSLMVHLRVAHYGYSHDSNGGQNGGRKKSNKASDVSVDETVAKASPKQKQQDNKQWECDVCSKMFTTKYFLKKHKRLHTGEMPYSCSQCSKSFTFQQSYHKHMLYHSSEKPYVCSECGRAFKELSTLQNHQRIHSGERPFGCETCGKRFRQRVSYLVHRRIHTGVMPYKCTACDKSFRYKVSQRSHKCPMNPPGSVVRIADVSDSAPSPTSVPSPVPVTTETESQNMKCIMSVDYATGNINFIPENQGNINILYIDNGEKKQPDNGQIQITYNKMDFAPNSLQYTNNNNDDGGGGGAVQDQRDLFSMVLSPLLPDVESLCLTNNSPDNSDNSQMLNTMDKLIYKENNNL